MDARGPETWPLEDGSFVTVQSTYYTARASSGTFHVEWELAPDAADAPDRESRLAIARPVLRGAVARGEHRRTAVTRVGSGAVPVDRIRASFHRPGGPTREVVVSDLDELYVWDWNLDGQSVRVFGPGYYTNTEDGSVTFTLRWHDPRLCPHLVDIDEERALALGEPVLRRAESLQLWRVVPLRSESGVSPPPSSVDRVGIQLGCPAPSCASGGPCNVRGYRASRPVQDP